MAFRRGRQTFRQQQQTLAQQFYADPGKQESMQAKLDDPATPEYVKEGIRARFAWAAKTSAYVPPKRNRVMRPVDGKSANDTEASVINAVGDLLHVHPKVLFAVRQNTGAMPYESNGRLVPVWFYKLVRKPGELTIVDYWGFLADKRPFAFECKRPSWKPANPTNRLDYARELKQETFLHMIRSLGGLAAFITDADQLSAILS